MDTYIRVCVSVVCTKKQLPAVLQVAEDHKFELKEINLEYMNADFSHSIFVLFQQYLHGDTFSVIELRAELAVIAKSK